MFCISVVTNKDEITQIKYIKLILCSLYFLLYPANHKLFKLKYLANFNMIIRYVELTHAISFKLAYSKSSFNYSPENFAISVDANDLLKTSDIYKINPITRKNAVISNRSLLKINVFLKTRPGLSHVFFPQNNLLLSLSCLFGIW